MMGQLISLINIILCRELSGTYDGSDHIPD